MDSHPSFGGIDIGLWYSADAVRDSMLKVAYILQTSPPKTFIYAM